MVKKINKKIILKFEDREIFLPNVIKDKIKYFWLQSIKENPNLYNGQNYVVEKVSENDEFIEMNVIKTSYAHYLYDERIGIDTEKYRCCVPWGGILLLTKDNYFVLGQMDQTTSVPDCLQISGGSIDVCDIKDGIIDIDLTIARELKEELNINIEDVDYKIQFIEYPDNTRNAYGFLAVGLINKTKKELDMHFKKYNEYLIDNKLELEFSKLIFLNKENALEELDCINNPKRPYIKELIKESMKLYTTYN